jgi:hypothetical protein
MRMSLRNSIASRPAVTSSALAAVASFSLAASLAPSAVLAAPTVRYQTGFEISDGYTVGSLTGQNNWSQFDGDVPSPDAFVQNSTVRALSGGSQAVMIQANGAASDPNADFTDVFSTDTGVSASALAAEPLVTVQFDMMRGTLGNGQFPTSAWGIDIYDSTDSAIAATIVAYDDQVGPAVAGTDDTGNFAFLGDGSARGTWDTYRIEMDYLAHMYTVWMDGVQLGDALPLNASADGGIGDVDFLALSRGTDAAYFDNLSITTQAIPEPASTLSIASLCGFSLTARRRRVC